MKENVVLSDLIYNPLKTKMVAIRRRKGATIHTGIGMFIEQGALAFEKWMYIEPDTKRMKEIVLKKLGGKSCLTGNKNDFYDQRHIILTLFSK
ncbi:hypothetical protein KHA80_03880 [Anaerobacillus sp. HL2]|nr:hypothetical protein KHA80_03880 [Anaerobacillus sp. HL2]